jgi:pyroglutamyl-peptidase
VIPDVDERKFSDDEASELWPEGKFPRQLGTGFFTDDVLGRWQQELDLCSHSGEVPVNGEDGAAGHQSKLSKDASQDILHNGDSHSKKPKPDVRLSPDAGNYMCGFIYYNSIAHYYSLDPTHLPVAFLHVPDLSSSKEKLDTGREVAVALIRALVESRRKVGIGGMNKGKGEGTLKEEVVVEGVRARTDVNFTA